MTGKAEADSAWAGEALEDEEFSASCGAWSWLWEGKSMRAGAGFLPSVQGCCPWNGSAWVLAEFGSSAAVGAEGCGSGQIWELEAWIWNMDPRCLSCCSLSFTFPSLLETRSGGVVGWRQICLK